MNETDVSDRLLVSLRTEYTMVAESWRFLNGIRFAVLTIAASLLAFLLGGYRYVFGAQGELGTIGKLALVGIPFFGVVTTYAMMVIEERTRNLYGCLLGRGRTLERLLGTGPAHFHALIAVPTEHPLRSHTGAIFTIYLMVYSTWTILLFVSFLRLMEGRSLCLIAKRFT